ncbi:MAG: HNH endonuclease [Anaerolineae bacterium]|nr:HNH endonuclease [Anaerolineae bacterium]
MSEWSWSATRRLVHERAQGCCEYCQTCEANTGQVMHVEHIDPSGGDDPENLCLSCANCNLSKAAAISASDPETGEMGPLFHPRQQVWSAHFQWVDRGLYLAGLTAVGRATIQRLQMNQERVVIARRRWVAGGFHPPGL